MTPQVFVEGGRGPRSLFNASFILKRGPGHIEERAQGCLNALSLKGSKEGPLEGSLNIIPLYNSYTYLTYSLYTEVAPTLSQRSLARGFSFSPFKALSPKP